MKKIVSMVLVFSIALTLLMIPTHAAPATAVLVYGEKLALKDQPIVSDKQVLVPLADILKALKIETVWNEKNQSIAFTKDGIRMKVTDFN